MGKPDSLTRHRLITRAAEQFKHTLVVAWCDATPIVADFVAHHAALPLSPDYDAAGHTWPEIFQSIVNQVAKHLLHRQPISGEVRDTFYHNFGVLALGLMLHRLD